MMCGGSDVTLSYHITNKIFLLCAVSYICVINIDAVVSKVLSIDRPLKNGEETVSLVY